MGVQFYIEAKVFNKTNFQRRQFQFSKYKSIIVIFLGLVGIWFFISLTKIGLIQNTAFWNVPGIPLSGIQLIIILSIIFLAWLIFPKIIQGNATRRDQILSYVLPIAIYLITIIVWGTTPMLKHYFSLQPTPPNYQPYPYSDARVHDLGAISINKGEGIYFHGYTDKPLYMVFLAFLHLFSGNDYVKISMAQILALGLIPVILFLLGNKFHSQLFGIVMAVVAIFQQKNAILLSYKIASVNPKLLVTEVITLLGVVIITYLLFLWMKTKKRNYALLIGGMIGTFSLIRINPIFLFPLVVILGILLLKNTPKLLLNHLLLFTLGFLIVFSPWLVSGINSQGQSWFSIKIQDVINSRYSQNTENSKQVSLNLVGYSITSDYQTTTAPTQGIETQEDNLSGTFYLITAHILHNISASLLILPDSAVIESLDSLSSREYWQDQNNWTGNFPTVQYVLIIINVAFIAIGLSESWKRHRWAGLVPLFVFIAYDISLGFAMNSGSRYIVPIDWIIFFYYFIGLIFILRLIFDFLYIGVQSTASEINIQNEEFHHRSFAHPLIITFAVLILIGSLTPITNMLIPSLVNSAQEENTIAIPYGIKNNGNTLVSGDILYPYNDQSSNYLTFDFLSKSEINSYKIDKNLFTNNQLVLESDLPAILSFSSLGGKQQLKAIYLLQENQPYLIWQCN
jgi:hypothetical protein